MIKNIKWILIASIGIVSCSQDEIDTSGVEPEVAVSAGTADFSKYVALGNSITAGYTDNALFKSGQMNAYPKLMAEQFATVGGGEFKVPYMNDNVGGLLFGGMPNPRFGPRLVFTGTTSIPLPGGVSTTEVFGPPLTGGFNNMGVPGAKSFHLLAPGYGDVQGLAALPATANPYFVRFASSATASVLSDAMAQSPTFFSLWIGNNDVLGYATTGGDGSDPITPVNGLPGVGFDGTYGALINTLTSAGAKGVVANIPDVASVPFFRTIPYNAITLTEAQVTALNAAYATYNGGLVAAGPAISDTERARRTINFVVGKNAPVIVDEYLTNLSGAGIPSYRQATSEDYLVLLSQGASTQAHLLAGNGTQFPLQDRWVLSKGEVDEIRAATAAYNTIIKNLADAKGLAFVDASAVLNQLASGGILSGTYHFSNQYVQGGAFGLDGVHLTARANSYVANKFLEAIEKTYGASFKKYKPQDFPINYPAFLP